MANDIFGNDYKWFDRTAILSLNTLITDYIVPSQRTIPQKFQIETMKSLTKLKEINLISVEEEYDYLSSDFYKSISEKDNTYNPGAFALIIYSINDLKAPKINKKKFNELLSIINDPYKMDSHELLIDYINHFGITCEDLIRYAIFIDNYSN